MSTQRISPASRLAERIANKLAEEQLVPSKSTAKVKKALEAGALTASDWRLHLELTGDEKQPKGGA